jgi:hypothetical protein
MSLAPIRSLVPAIGLFGLLLTLPQIALAANLITNPSFDPDSTGWSQNVDGTNDGASGFGLTTGHTGTNAASVTITSYTNGDAKWETTAPVTGGQTYTFSDWYKSSVLTSVFIYYTGLCSDGVSNAAVGCWIGDVSASANLSTWTQSPVMSFTLPAGVTSVTIAHTLAGVGTLVTDDYSLDQHVVTPVGNGFVTLTFDDGWKSYSDVAFPIMQAAGIKSTAYIITLGNSQFSDDYMATSTLTHAPGHRAC